MPDEITLAEYRALQRTATHRPALALPRAARTERDASEATRQPFCDRGWVFAVCGAQMEMHAVNRLTGVRVGPAETRRALLAMIDEEEATNDH